MSGKKIIDGLSDAIAFANGDKSRGREFTIAPATNALIARLQAATEGSLELNQAIAAYFGTANTYTVPMYTERLDAALTLVPDGFGYAVLVSRDRSDCRADIWGDTKDRPFETQGVATPALALCIACLKARVG